MANMEDIYGLEILNPDEIDDYIMYNYQPDLEFCYPEIKRYPNENSDLIDLNLRDATGSIYFLTVAKMMENMGFIPTIEDHHKAWVVHKK